MLDADHIERNIVLPNEENSSQAGVLQVRKLVDSLITLGSKGEGRTRPVLISLENPELSEWDNFFHISRNMKESLQRGILFVMHPQDWQQMIKNQGSLDSGNPIKNTETTALSFGGAILKPDLYYKVRSSLVWYRRGKDWENARVVSQGGKDVDYFLLPRISNAKNADQSQPSIQYDLEVFPIDKYGRPILSIVQDYRRLLGKNENDVLLEPKPIASFTVWLPRLGEDNRKPIEFWYDHKTNQTGGYFWRHLGYMFNEAKIPSLTNADLPTDPGFTFGVEQMLNCLNDSNVIPAKIE